ncbi:MAG: PD-(D/E)XK nuclease family protein [Dehalococcoidia bacterium]|nr:PD-(D/E)XK nuclease family protein [Dehalococcoidia bacterium]
MPRLVDYKTGNKPPETDWTQLYLQALVLSCRQLAPVSRASFLYLGPSTMETTTVSQDVLDGAMWELLNTAHKILQERKYRATPGTWCGYCDFTPICTARGGEDPASSTPEGQLKLWDYTLEDAD